MIQTLFADPMLAGQSELVQLAASDNPKDVWRAVQFAKLILQFRNEPRTREWATGQLERRAADLAAVQAVVIRLQFCLAMWRTTHAAIQSKGPRVTHGDKFESYLSKEFRDQLAQLRQADDSEATSLFELKLRLKLLQK